MDFSRRKSFKFLTLLLYALLKLLLLLLDYYKCYTLIIRCQTYIIKTLEMAVLGFFLLGIYNFIYSRAIIVILVSYS